MPEPGRMKEAVCFTEKYLYIRLKNMCHNVFDEWKRQHFDDFIMFEGAGVSVDDVKSLKICGEDFKRNMGDYYMQMINFFPLCPGIFGAIGDSEDRSKNYFACPFSKKYNLQFSHLFWLNQATGLCDCEEFNTKEVFLKHVQTSVDKSHKCLEVFINAIGRDKLKDMNSSRYTTEYHTPWPVDQDMQEGIMRKLEFVNCDMVENKRGKYIYPKEWYKSELEVRGFHYKEKFDEKDESDSDDERPLLTVLNLPKFLKDYYKDDEHDNEILVEAQDNHADGN